MPLYNLSTQFVSDTCGWRKRTPNWKFMARIWKGSLSQKEYYSLFYEQNYKYISEMSTNMIKKYPKVLSLFFVTEKKNHVYFTPKK